MLDYTPDVEDVKVAILHGQEYDYILLEEYIYITKAGLKIIVPKGFRTDFASTPKFMWNIIPPTGKYTRASLVHDFLYSTDCKLILNRRVCDSIFNEVMEAHGTSVYRRESMYRAVRLFGSSHFR